MANCFVDEGCLFSQEDVRDNILEITIFFRRNKNNSTIIRSILRDSIYEIFRRSKLGSYGEEEARYYDIDKYASADSIEQVYREIKRAVNLREEIDELNEKLFPAPC